MHNRSHTAPKCPRASSAAAAPSPSRVLVVDDDAAERARLAALLQARHMTVACAADGEAARQLALHFRPDLVISDWCMPRLDGLQLCRALREAAPAQQPYIILVTGRDGHDDLVCGLAAGADDFVAKPYRASELMARLDAGQRQLQRSRRQPTAALAPDVTPRGALDASATADLAAAAGLQARFIPPRHAQSGLLEAGCLFRPAGDLAGDTVGYRYLADGRFAFYLADVAGHGVLAALDAFALARLLAATGDGLDLLAEAGLARRPADVVSALNRRFCDDTHCDQYFTMIYGTLDPATGRVLLCQAGHPHPIVISPGGAVRRIGSGGFPVGLVGEACYHEVEFSLAPGERLLLTSDGTLDHLDSGGEPFGPDRLLGLLHQHRGRPVPLLLDALESALDEWSVGTSSVDDISTLVIGMPA